MDVMRRETFGPVAPVRVVGSFDAALAVADATEYGLAATVLTCSQEHAHAPARSSGRLRPRTARRAGGGQGLHLETGVPRTPA